MFLLDLLFPARCVGCGKEGTYLCERCLSTVNFEPIQRCAVCNRMAISGKTHERCRSPWGIDGVWAACGYNGVVKKLLRKFKYGYASRMDQNLVELLVRSLPEFARTFDLIIPLPLHASRWRWRGYNQAELLAKGLGSKLKLSVEMDLLARNIYSGPQAMVRHRGERLRNIDAGVFQINDGRRIRGKSVLIVDDIVTTGSTLRAAAQVLKRVGARSVWGIVVAR